MAINPSSNLLNLDVKSTSCITSTQTGTGSKNDPVVVCLTPNTSDSIECTPDGLAVNVHTMDTEANCLKTVLTGNGTLLDPLAVEAVILADCDPCNLIKCSKIEGEEGGLLVKLNYEVCSPDSKCLDFDVKGWGTCEDPLKFSASLNVSGVDDNGLRCIADGLFVAKPSITVTPNSCIEILVDESTDCDFTLTPTIKIDQVSPNLLACTSEGLRVAPPVIQGIDTYCAETCVEGTGTDADPIRITVQPNVLENDCNLLQCTPDGMFVPDLTHIKGSLTKSMDINVIGTGTPQDPKCIVGEVRVGGATSQGLNQIICNPDGLYVAPPVITGGGGGSTGPIIITIEGSGTPGDPIIVLPDININIDIDNLLEVLGDGTLTVSCDKVRSCLGPIFKDPTFVWDEDNSCVSFMGSTDECNGLKIGSDGRPFVPPYIGSCNSCFRVDVNCETNTITGEVIVANRADNAISCTNEGLYFQKYQGVNSTCFSDVGCIDVFVNGSQISATLTVSEDEKNAISCTEEGLFATKYFGMSTSSVAVCVDDCNIIANVVLNEAKDNLIKDTPVGLYVAPMTGRDNGCITTSVENGTIVGTLNVSDAECNKLVKLGDGYFVDGRQYGEFDMGIGGCILECPYSEIAYPFFTDREIHGFAWYLREAPVGSDLTVQITIDGQIVKVFNVPSGTPNLSSGTEYFNPAVSVSEGQALSFNVISAGATIPASDLTMVFRYSECI